MMQSRTHNCGQLRIEDAGRSVKIVGWMENIREVSSALAFIVVRDFYGTTQVVAETEDMVRAFKAVTRESTISVEGTVREYSPFAPVLVPWVVPSTISVAPTSGFPSLSLTTPEIRILRSTDSNTSPFAAMP